MKEYINRYPVTSFLLITLFITWFIGIFAAVFLGMIEKILGITGNPFSNLIIKYGPTLGGFVTIYHLHGETGVKSLFLKGVKWRISPTAFIFALFMPCLIVLITILTIPAKADLPDFQISEMTLFLPLLLMKLFFGGGFGEEFGWRGFMLPQLSRTYKPIYAGIIIGVVWVIWHLPAYVLGDKGTEDPIIPFTVQVVTLSVVLTWLYFKSDESVLPAAIFHASFNAVLMLVERVYGDSPGYVAYYGNFYWGFMVISVLVAIFLIALSGPNLGRKATSE